MFSQVPDFSNARVLVVGDVMLDRYWFGNVTRISPEAPVPIAQINQTDHRAGGAANVAHNIAALGGKAALMALVGNDEAADTLEQIIQQDGIQMHFYRSMHTPTTVKLRVLARHQQLIRLDFEEQVDIICLQKLESDYSDLLKDFDVIILSDYGKGVLQHVENLIAAAQAAGKMVLIDPKGNNYRKYTNATLLTPNRDELRAAIGSWHSEEELSIKAEMLRHDLNLKALLLTRSEEGMSLYYEEGNKHQPTHAQEVFDVSGAGDTVIATLGLCLAAGCSLLEAMHFANAAAGVVVAKLGTAVCTTTELQQALSLLKK